MNLSSHQLQETASMVNHIIEEIIKSQHENELLLESVCEEYRHSAENLLNYKKFRDFDVRKLQEKLKALGLTRLANAEGNILGSLLNLKELLGRLNGEGSTVLNKHHLSIGEGNRLLVKHTQQLFGTHKDRRRVRIMVTQPAEAAENYEMVLAMVKNGMDCARINCAHDGPEVWESIVGHVRKAAKECSTEVKIAMDLAGPKIRTGGISPGPEVKKFRPKRDAMGKVIGPSVLKLVSDSKEMLAADELPVPGDWLAMLELEDVLVLKDAREKRRKLKVEQVDDQCVWASCLKTSYIATETKIRCKRGDVGNGIVGKLPEVEQYIVLRTNDILHVTEDSGLGSLPEFDGENRLVRPASISCIPGNIVQKVKEGESIFFDDGKIEGVIEKVQRSHFEVRIIKANGRGAKLRAEKGINLPETEIGLSGLTEKDKQDLEFVAKHADIVNFSFVNTKSDIDELLKELERLQVLGKLSIILKIETKKAFGNLVEMLLAAMKTRYVGIMIARGDLALEVGWRNMGRVQDEILSLCSAAHIPVVWATQVLEGLAKKGVPSRSEITDSTSSIQAECVMLNKGPHINEAIAFLDEILGDMENRFEKKEGLWPKMDWT